MPEKKPDQNKEDIKPERSQSTSLRASRKLRGSGMLLSTVLGFINLIGLSLLFILFMNTSGNQQETGKGFIERISILEEQLNEEINTYKDFSVNIEEDLKFINKEIRKLWDLSNKRNRKQISENVINLNEIKTALVDLEKMIKEISAKQGVLDLELRKLDNYSNKLKSDLALSDSIEDRSFIRQKIDDQQEAIASIDSYRIQTNKRLLNLQSRIESLESTYIKN
tara:strand:+ start:49813 stop:50484 length:672 start_codon:yes stop_codon:yes gene_type:complete